MLSNVTVADMFRPSEKTWAGVYDIVLIVAGSLLIGLCAQIKFFIPFSPVPVTAQTFAVLVTGVLLGSRRGALSAGLYIFEGAAGLPVFAVGVGPAVLFGPSGGYVFGFVPAAHLTGLLAEMGWDRKVGTTILAMILGNVTLFVFGLSWLSFLIGVKGALTVGLYPFIVGDVLKIALAAVMLPAGWKLLKLLPLPEKENKKRC